VYVVASGSENTCTCASVYMRMRGSRAAWLYAPLYSLFSIFRLPLPPSVLPYLNVCMYVCMPLSLSLSLSLCLSVSLSLCLSLSLFLSPRIHGPPCRPPPSPPYVHFPDRAHDWEIVTALHYLRETACKCKNEFNDSRRPAGIHRFVNRNRNYHYFSRLTLATMVDLFYTNFLSFFLSFFFSAITEIARSSFSSPFLFSSAL